MQAIEAQRRVLGADTEKLPVHIGSDRGEQGYVIYRVIRSLPPEPRTEVQKTSDLANAHRLAGAQQFEAWLTSERARVKVEINRSNLEKK